MEGAHATGRHELADMALAMGRSALGSALPEEDGTCDVVRSATQLAGGMLAAGRQDDVRPMALAVAVGLVASLERSAAPLATAGFLLDLATGMADLGEVALACDLAGQAQALRHHPAARHRLPFEFGPEGGYLRFADFFLACAAGWARAGSESQAMEALGLAEAIDAAERRVGGRQPARLVIGRRLRVAEVCMALGRDGQAVAELELTEMAFGSLWERARRAGRVIETELYELPSVAAAWFRLAHRPARRDGGRE